MNTNEQNATAPTWRLAADAHSRKKRERVAAALPALRALLDDINALIATTPRQAPHHLEVGRAVHKRNAVRTAIYTALLYIYGKPVPEHLRQVLGKQMRNLKRG